MSGFRVRFADSTYQVVAHLSSRLQVPMAEVVRDALSIYWWLARERMAGSRLLIERGGDVNELTIPSLERLRPEPGLT